MTTLTRLATTKDIQGISFLRNQNSIESVGKSHQGFVTCTFSEQLLEECIRDIGIIVSVTPAEEVIGYIILMSMAQTEKYYSDLASWYKRHYAADYNTSILNRQYCVDKQHRGGHVVRSLYEYQRSHLVGRGVQWSIGEIDPVNRISIVTACRMLRYQHIGNRSDGSVDWWIGRRGE